MQETNTTPFSINVKMTRQSKKVKKSLKIVAMTEIKLRKLIQISILCNKNFSNILYEALCEFLFILVGS